MKRALTILAVSLVAVVAGSSGGCGNSGKVGKNAKGENVMEGQRFEEFEFKVKQALAADPNSIYAVEAFESVAIQYTGAELELFKAQLEAHWQKIKDDATAREDVKKFCLHAVEKARGQATTWSPEVKPRGIIPPDFGPNEGR
jgi:hypothetical protein